MWHDWNSALGDAAAIVGVEPPRSESTERLWRHIHTRKLNFLSLVTTARGNEGRWSYACLTVRWVVQHHNVADWGGRPAVHTTTTTTTSRNGRFHASSPLFKIAIY
jgi:hypothetical protein